MKNILLVVPQNELDDAEHHLSNHKPFNLGIDCVYCWTADCGNGIQVDVKVVDASEEGGGPWTEAVMFEHGSEIACTDVGEESVRGDWIFDDEGIHVVVVGSDEVEPDEGATYAMSTEPIEDHCASEHCATCGNIDTEESCDGCERTAAIKLIEHILAMRDDAYLIGHPEWCEIVKDAKAARDEMTEAALDATFGPMLDKTDRQLLAARTNKWVGIGMFARKHEYETVVFVSHIEPTNSLEGIFTTFEGVPVMRRQVVGVDPIDIATSFCDDCQVSLPSEILYHILEIGADGGWGLYQYVCDPPNQEYWKLVDSYCPIEAAERRMSDVAHANDVRFGAPSDHEDWYRDYR